jgi:hypothetical protein
MGQADLHWPSQPFVLFLLADFAHALQGRSCVSTGGEGAAILDGLTEDIMKRLLTRENLLALGLCVLVILLIIATTDASPKFIYQQF